MEDIQKSATSQIDYCGKSDYVCRLLHNFCINGRAQESTVTNEQADNAVFIPSDVFTSAVYNTSLVQYFVVQDISAAGLVRPAQTIEQNMN